MRASKKKNKKKKQKKKRTPWTAGGERCGNELLRNIILFGNFWCTHSGMGNTRAGGGDFLDENSDNCGCLLFGGRACLSVCGKVVCERGSRKSLERERVW